MHPPIPSPSLFGLQVRERSWKLSKSPSTVSTAFQTVELDAQDLETFVSQELPQHLGCTNNSSDYNGGTGSALYRNLQHQVRQLSRHSQQNKNIKYNDKEPTFGCPDDSHCTLCSPEFIGEVILSLQSVIESTPSLSASATADLHSMIGLLRHQKGDPQGAIRSFLRVLWIQSACQETKSPYDPTTNTSEREGPMDSNADNDSLVWKIALTRHRLAMAFASTDNLTDAVKLLEQALSDYNEHQNNTSNSNLAKCHRSVVEQAETDWKLTKILLDRQRQKSQRRQNIRRSSSTSVAVKQTARASMRRSTTG